MTSKTIEKITKVFQSTEQRVNGLQQRLETLRAEQASKTGELITLRTRLAQLDAQYTEAQRRYDVELDETAGEELEPLRRQRLDVQQQIGLLEAMISEYPARLVSVQHEIDALLYRTDITTLDDKRQTLVDAALAYEQAMIAALAAYDALAPAMRDYEGECNRLGELARRIGQPAPDRTVSNSWIPQPAAEWFVSLSNRETELQRFAHMRKLFQTRN